MDRPGSGKQERYLQPSILIGLRKKASYGYELIHTIQDFGFIEGQAPPGMIYRHLRQMEKEGLVTSEWQTKEGGAAKRMYTISDEGEEVLLLWMDYIRARSQKLQKFIALFESLEDKA